MVSFSDAQQQAIEQVAEWVRCGAPGQVFRLFGFAGSGKTSIAKAIATLVAEEHGKRVEFAAFTGKAASVLRKKGCDAITIHQLIYKRAPDKDTKEDLAFQPRDRALSSSSCALVIVDECSMVGNAMGEDLVSFGVPILVLGDPAQLPPVGDGGFFTDSTPDVMLDEVFRQQNGGSVLSIATEVRELRRLPNGVARPLKDIHSLDLTAYDQVLCGKNSTRRMLNGRARDAMGYTDDIPEVGEKLVCLRNNRQLGLMNGEMVTVLEVTRGSSEQFHMVYDKEGETGRATVSLHYMLDKAGTPPWGGTMTFFDFGYAITCHKSQGSEWGSVLVVNESRVFGADAWRWLYTAITRASEAVEVIG
jgi:exodeoxyribonuclease V